MIAVNKYVINVAHLIIRINVTIIEMNNFKNGLKRETSDLARHARHRSRKTRDATTWFVIIARTSSVGFAATPILKITTNNIILSDALESNLSN